MKIKKVIQVMTHFYPCGQTKYAMEVQRGLRENGVDAKFYVFESNQTWVSGNLELDKDLIVEYVDFTQEVFDEMNTADAIFFHDMPLAKMTEEYRNAWVDMVQNKITTKKVQFINAHKWGLNSRANGDFVRKPDFLNLMDKIVTFATDNDFSLYYKERTKSDTYDSKFVHLLLPYHVDETKAAWKPLDKKYRRVTYMGRCVQLKDPCRLIEMCPELAKHGYQCDMRGIVRTIAVIGFKDLIYNYGTTDPSDKTFFLTKKYRDDKGISKDDDCVHLDREFKDKVYVFGEYKNSEGKEMLSWSAFGCDFFDVTSKKLGAAHNCGDNGEYAMVEMFDVGTIPLIDYDFAANCKLYENGEWTGETWLSANLGIPVKDDLSNMSEAIERLNFLMDNPNEYEKYREYCFDLVKRCHDPKDIVAKMLADIGA